LSAHSPLVSIVVVNCNGREHLQAGLPSLGELDWPPGALEIILVDNASTDDSLTVARGLLPHIRVLPQDHNLGFAPACNLGARAARGEFVAFLNNDARVPPNWLKAMTAPFAAPDSADLACAASKILSWDGRLVDFVGGALNVYGRAFQVDQGLPYEEGRYREARELLFACGGAMLIRRAVFLDAGGFDDDFVAYFEDVDLGWRLWLLGWRVALAPDAVAYHRLHATGARLGTHRRFFISELNALRMIVKNYSDENLQPVLITGLLSGAQRAALHGGLRPGDFDFPGPLDESPEWRTEDRPHAQIGESYVAAMSQMADELPYWLAKRAAIQPRRRRTDDEIFSKFPLRPSNPVFPWRRHALNQQSNLKALGVSASLHPRHTSSLLIICHETVGPKMAGPAVRCVEFARALARHAEVTLAAPGQPDVEAAGFRAVGYQTFHDLEPAINAAGVVLALGQLVSRVERLRQLDRPLIVDWYDPFEIEKLAMAEAVHPENWPLIDRQSHEDLNLQARAGDFYLCASERQRDLWLGVLLSSGRVNMRTYADDPGLRSLIDVAPFGLPADPPRRTGAGVKGVHPGIRATDRLLYWGGGLWQWFDPLLLLDAMADIAAQRDDVKLLFAAGLHFDQGTVPEMPIYRQVRERAAQLGLLDRAVFFGGWVPYGERQNYLLEADLGLSLHRDGLESRFAFRTRLLDYLWAGLPMVVTRGDPLAEVVEQHRLGIVVPPGDKDALVKAILELLAREDVRREMAPRFAAVAAEHTWERVVQPIVRFLAAPRHAPDARRAVGGLDLAVRVKSLQETLDVIQSGRIMRFIRFINRLRGVA
jgi:GT2 family glycosyltransferase/glycosyltransferase involved in cell wall biosynthesis